MKGILEILKFFLVALGMMFIVPFPGFIYFVVIKGYIAAYEKTTDGNILFFVIAIVSTALFIIIIAGSKYDEIIESKERLKADYDQQKKKLENDYNEREIKLTNKMNEREAKLNKLIESSSPFRSVASMVADIKTAILKDRENYLRYKRYPSPKSATEVRLLRKEMNSIISDLKEKEYKYEFLINSYPELAGYVDNDEDLIRLVDDCASYKDVEDTYDRSRDYLSEMEWKALSETERNQLALDRYTSNRKKYKSQIGRDYEMACGYVYSKRGFRVTYTGMKYGLKDLGRDLIASKKIGGLFRDLEEVDLVQCKCWRKGFPIRENVIMQLYGSAIEFELENKTAVKPVLMVPSFTEISEGAMKFAKYLKISIVVQDFVDFPRIKCNINGLNKIYHLPFDQQYNRTEIKNTGEFYAWTVKEAESRGFRRALRHSCCSMH